MKNQDTKLQDMKEGKLSLYHPSSLTFFNYDAKVGNLI